MKNEDGFSLIELLVVLGLLSIVGASILTVATTTLRAERTAEDLARNLDDTRIAVERVRDEVRGADGVCQDSDAQAMTVWTDRNADGTVDPGEVVTFELVDGDGDKVLQRREDDGSTRRLAGRLVDAEAFTYLGPGRSETVPTLDCSEGASPGASAVAIVDLFFEVEGDGVDTSGPLSVETTIVLRNAGLVSSGGGGSEAALRIASIVVDESAEEGIYDITVELEGMDLTHPVDDVSFEIRCGEEGEWVDLTPMAHSVDDRYTGTWDNSACDAEEATVLVTARDGEEDATAQVVIELEDDEAEPSSLAVEIVKPVDGSTIGGEQPIDLNITGVPEEATANVGVVIEREDGAPTEFDESGSVDADGEWRAGIWDADGIDAGTYVIRATVVVGEESADDSVSVSRPRLVISAVVPEDDGGNWKAKLTFFVTDGNGDPVDGADVNYTVASPGGEPDGSCTTTLDGEESLASCEVSFPQNGTFDDDDELKVNFTAFKAGYEFDDSEGFTSILVKKSDVRD